MNRRTFLAACTAAGALNRSNGATRQVRISVDTRRTLGAIPANFAGLGYEISSVAVPGLLSAENRTYVQLVRGLGSQGVIRIGGNTSDDASFEPDGSLISAPKGTVVNQASLRQLGAFLHATGWRLIWGLNLGSGDQHQAVAEAQAVATAAGRNLLAFEIGNEPDLFGRGTPHRPKSYGYDAYLKEYRRFKTAIRATLPNAPFAGPDAASATDWVERFAADEGGDLKLLTHHYYRECAHPSSTLDLLLHPDPKLAPLLQKLRGASETAHLPYRICETNSFCGGGKPGVSDTFGAALWVLDFMFRLAHAGGAGVNMETGVNQLGFISSYSPIADGKPGTYTAKPEYYGMLAFAHASQGERVAVDYDPADLNLTSYAVVNGRKLALTVVNKDATSDARVTMVLPEHLKSGNVMRLTGPSLDSKAGVTFGGAAMSEEGAWKPHALEPLKIHGGRCEMNIPAASAAVATFV